MTPFRKLMAANRGEIAIRVFRRRTSWASGPSRSTRTRIGSRRIASRPTRRTRSVAPGEPIRSYLDIPAIVELAREKEVDAIHPGYGFLSENAEFARACAGGRDRVRRPPAGGARPARRQGRAHVAWREAGVPVLSGSDAPVQAGAEARALAEALGYPVIVKAAMGGGGRGMRVVESAMSSMPPSTRPVARPAPPSATPTSSSRSSSSAPRHIEVQILGDRHGNLPPPVRARLLGPAPASEGRRDRPGPEPRPDASATAICDAAVAIAGSVGYDNAGTVEFLLDADTGEFYFIEVNPRIQVEHTVTEVVTGVDLVNESDPDRRRDAARRPAIGLPDQSSRADPGLRHPMPRHDRGSGEPLHARITDGSRITARRRRRHPPRRRPGIRRRASSRRSTIRCW